MGLPPGLAPKQLRALDRLKSIRSLDSFYLAGGSAVAIHLHHRTSMDLDLFSRTKDANLEEIAAAASAAIPDFRVLALSDVTMRALVGGVVVDIVCYRYPPLSPPIPGPLDFPVAGLRDLAAMKLAAISRLGLRRDFWDLFAICGASLSLTEACQAYLERFGKAQSDLYHVIRSLTYFDDAEKETVLPAGMTPALWESIKSYFAAKVPALLTELP